MKLQQALALVPLAILCGAAAAQPVPLLDYRDRTFLTGSAYYSQPEREEVAQALKAAPNGLAHEMGERFVILGDADGAFSAPGRSERVYLVQKRSPLSIQPFPDGPAPVLIVLDHGESAGVYPLPGDVQYQRLVAAADGNADQRDEILLETSFLNMGQMVVSIDIVELDAHGTASVGQTLSEVYADACDNPAGARSRRAATVMIGSDGFTAEPHELGCED